MKLTNIILITGLLGLAACESVIGNKSGVPSIKPEKGLELFGHKDYIFLDVRTVEEHRAGAIPNTPLIPVQELEARIEELEQYKDKKIVVYCRSGNRSGKATAIMMKHGFDAVNLSGGMIKWPGPVTSNE